MAIEDIELDVGGTKFKGVWIAILVSFASTLGGGIWATSEFFSRLEALEENVDKAVLQAETLNARFDEFSDGIDEEIDGFENSVAIVQKQVENAGIDELQGKLAELGTNLKSILERQQELLQLQNDIAALNQSVTEMQVTVQKAESTVEKVDSFDAKVKKLEREVEDLWEGLDYLSNPYGS